MNEAMAQSRGSRAFASAVKKGGGYRRMMDRLGCSIVSVHHWISGKRRPSADNLLRMKTELGIPIDWWFEPAAAQSEAA